MKTLNQVVEHPSGFDSLANYMGESDFPGWYVVLTRTRDSDCLERSNWDVALTLLGGESDNVCIHRFGHWACGWWKALCVLADTVEFETAQNIENRLTDYPILDESHYSEAETQEANDVWRDCYNWRDRIKYIREHASQFEFRGFRDTITCVRGEYFAGDTYELLH